MYRSLSIYGSWVHCSRRRLTERKMRMWATAPPPSSSLVRCGLIPPPRAGKNLLELICTPCDCILLVLGALWPPSPVKTMPFKEFPLLLCLDYCYCHVRSCPSPRPGSGTKNLLALICTAPHALCYFIGALCLIPPSPTLWGRTTC
jgi:hypothetical protein